MTAGPPTMRRMAASSMMTHSWGAFGAVEGLLAGGADLDAAVDFGGVQFHRAAADQGAGVVLGLQQAGHHSQLEVPDGAGFGFRPMKNSYRFSSTSR